MSDRLAKHSDATVWADAAPETLRGKSLGLARLSKPPVDLMACYCFRSWGAEDAPLFRHMLDDADLWQHMYETFPGEITTELAQSLIDLSRQASHHKVRAVEYRGRVIGQVRMQWETAVTPPQTGEISYWLGREYWGLGLAAPMIALFTWRCLSIFPALSTITARVHRENVPSQRVLTWLGWSKADAQGDWDTFQMHRADGLDWTSLRKPGALPD